ncbi:MAG: selenocysteine-specific translation elongation factor [Planctomycetota bacterium]|nr:MAG: selenocysteine-specific translation elongation factor [Planctomycetota bacterium]
MDHSAIYRVVVGTAGHVDHGKTALVKLFTGIDADRLSEEKQRQLSIDFGFANFKLPDGRRVGVIDVPGHRDYLKNMIAGTTGVDFLILVVAADEGIMPQTRAHMEVCRLLGVQHGFTVITKTDLVDDELLEMARLDVEEFIKESFLDGKPIINVSSKTGIGLPDLLEKLYRSLLKMKPRSDDGIFRMYVQRVFSKKGIGTVVSGIPDFGRIGVNDPVIAIPSGKSGRVRGIQAYFQEISEGAAGHSTAIAIAGIKTRDVRRGDAIVFKDTHEAATGFTARFEVLKSFPRSITHYQEGMVYLGTREFSARIRLLMGNSITSNDQALVQIMTDSPIPVFSGDRFIFRLPAPLGLVGGGTVIGPESRRLRRNAETLRNVLDYESCLGNPRKTIYYAINKSRMCGLTISQAAAEANILKSECRPIIDELIKEGKLVAFGKHYFTNGNIEYWKEKLIESVRRYHAEKPWKEGAELNTLRDMTKLPNQTLGFALSICFREGRLAKEKDLIKLPEHRLSVPRKLCDLAARVEAVFLKNLFAPPVLSNLLKDFPDNEREVSTVLEYLENVGRILSYQKRDYFHARLLEKTWNILFELSRKHRKIKKQQVREATKMPWRCLNGVFFMFRDMGILKEGDAYDEFFPNAPRSWRIETVDNWE